MFLVRFGADGSRQQHNLPVGATILGRGQLGISPNENLISRAHLTIAVAADGKVTLTPTGMNPVHLESNSKRSPLAKGVATPVKPLQSFWLVFNGGAYSHQCFIAANSADAASYQPAKAAASASADSSSSPAESKRASPAREGSEPGSGGRKRKLDATVRVCFSWLVRLIVRCC
jgi:hypothetical protein